MEDHRHQVKAGEHPKYALRVPSPFGRGSG